MPDSRANIVLTGFMGTGKTTVGKIIAERTGRPFVDSDDEIVRSAGRAISAIFAHDGEAAFREIERAVCRDLATCSGLVIATGGGMLIDPENRRRMMASGFVVCLKATPDAIAERLQASNERPLLHGDWRALLEQRQAAYRAILNQIDTTGKTPADVAGEIVTLWQNASQ